jgi:DNA-binding winged helix-turn-helix (wHTH) protein/TolB-like protein
MSTGRIRFGDFELDLTVEELRRAGTPVPLQPQPMKVLVLLARNPGCLVTRDELQRTLWGGTFVDHENGLNWCVRKVRQALGDDPESPSFIETLPKKGYRFIAPVAEMRPNEAQHRTRRLPVAAAVAALLALAAGISLLPRARTAQHQPTVVVLPFDNLTGQSDRDFLATAATDHIITGMGTTNVNVIDRATAAKLKRQEECVIHIGEQLHADLVVEGSLIGPADSPLVTAGVYRVRDNTQLWAGQVPAGADQGAEAYRLIAAKVAQLAALQTP